MERQKQNHYLFVIDESGNLGLSSKAFILGGYVIEENEIQAASRFWQHTKAQISISPSSEVKWQHFFADNHTNNPNPLIEQNPLRRRILARNIAIQIFEHISIIPLMAIVRKQRITSPSLFTVSKSGKSVLNIESLLIVTLTSFGRYLQLNMGTGSIFCDRLPNTKQEQKYQRIWTSFQTNSLLSDEQIDMLQRIDNKIQFLESEVNNAIQIADCLCGIMFSAASKGDETFLSEVYKKFGPEATGAGLGIFRIQ